MANKTPNPDTRFNGSKSNRKNTGGNSKRITCLQQDHFLSTLLHYEYCTA